MKKAIVALALMALVLCGCYQTEDIGTPQGVGDCVLIGVPYNSLSRCIDKDAAIVCYTLSNTGLVCMPLDETALEGVKE